MTLSQKSITILGGGTAGWIAANIFAQKWSEEKVKVTLIESPDVSIIGVGEGSTPALKHFFKSMGISDREWMPRCNATYKLNIKFKGWSPGSDISSYSHPFTSQVDVFTANHFLTNTQTRRLGLDCNVTPEDFLLNGVLARQGKGPLTPDNFPFAVEYGYHFDSHLLGEYLSELAIKNGVHYQKVHINDAERDNKGNILSLVGQDGQRFESDIFVDCSGFSSILMTRVLGEKFKLYKDNLFNDSAVVLATPISEQIPVETVSTALSAGWCWKIPLTNRFGNGYVYSSDFISETEAELELRNQLGVDDNYGEARHLKMNVGRLENQWFKNCVALGLSQGFIEPLEATALHLVQTSAEIFADLYERGEYTQRYQQKYNNEVNERFERVRDYIVAHYKLNTRNDSEYWIANRENTHLSDSLVQILNAWYQRTDLRKSINWQQQKSHFDVVSWHCLLAGYGAFPPIASEQPGRGDLYVEQNIESFLQGCSLNFENHRDNIS